MLTYAGVVVEGLTEIGVDSIANVLDIIELAQSNRYAYADVC
jgi:hypothetical protein